MNTQFKRENAIMEFRKNFGNQFENVPKMAIFDLFFAVAKGDDSSAAFMALSSAILTPIWGGICLF